MAESSNSATQDFNQDSQSTLQEAESVGKSFLRNVRDKWSKVPQGWAQKRTNNLRSPEQVDVMSNSSEEIGISSGPESSTTPVENSPKDGEPSE